MKHKERLDVLLVARNLAESRSKAQAMIMACALLLDSARLRATSSTSSRSLCFIRKAPPASVL